MSFNYYANKTFAQVHQDPNRFIFVRGPVGSGKSVGCIMHCWLNAMQQEPSPDGVRRSKFGVLRATYPALKTTVVSSWRQWFGGLMKIVYDTPIRGHLEMPHPDGKTSIEMDVFFIALDREEDTNKLQSLELTGSHINEAVEIPKGVFNMLKSRINRFPSPNDGGATKAFILLDYNSPDTEHWLYDLAEENKPTEKHSFYAQPPAMLWDGHGYVVNPLADNLGHYEPGTPKVKPTPKSVWIIGRDEWWVPHLPEDYYPDIVSGNDWDYINVFVLNNYGMLRTGKPVYPHYKDSIHCSAKNIQPMAGVPMIIGMDMGLTPAAAFMQLTPTGQLAILDEIVTEDCSIRKFCEDYLKPKLKNEYPGMQYHLVIDPAATARSQNDARSAADIVRDSGLPFMTARTQNELARREAVNYFLLKTEGFLLSPNCKTLRKGFISEYKFEKIRAANSDKFKEKPEKNIFSHIHDGLQYGALELSEGRIGKRKPKRPSKTANRPADSMAGY